MMTFSEVIETKGAYNVFPITDTPLNTLITNWYSSRVIGCENVDDFIRFFKRIYYKDYHAYCQMLRLDPRVTDYDWLVQTYRERQKTNDLAVNGSKSETHIDNKAYNTAENNDGAGTDTSTKTLNTQDNNIVKKTGSSGTQVSHSTNGNRGVTTDFSHSGQNTQTVKTTGSAGTLTDTNSSGLSKSTPMSVIYNNNGAVVRKNIKVKDHTVHTDTVDGLDFTYADGQTLASVKGGVYNENENTDKTTGSESYNDDTHVSDISSITGSSDTDATFDNSESGYQSHTGTITDTKNNSISSEKTVTGTVTDTVNVSGVNGSKTEALEREIWTGRDKEVAELLARACTYISQTDAFSWLCDKLDVCFYGIYE